MAPGCFLDFFPNSDQSRSFKASGFEGVLHENFLAPQDFELLCSIRPKKIHHNGLLIFDSSIDSNGNVSVVNWGDESLIRHLHATYHPRLAGLLKSLSPLKYHLYDYTTYHLMFVDSKYPGFPVHTDTPSKLLSTVIYLSPAVSEGTHLHLNKDRSYSHSIEWRQNRSFTFSRIGERTWHSYRGHSSGIRTTLSVNMCTSRLDEIEDIEKKQQRLFSVPNPLLIR